MLKSDDPNARHICKECGESLPHSEFFANSENGHLYPRCKKCHYKFERERRCAKKAGRRLNKRGKPISESKSQAKVQSKEVGPYKTKALTPGKRSYMAEVQKSANEMITNIRDAAFNMAKTISETYDIDTLQPREAYQVAISLKSLNEVVLTNNLFLKNNIDLSTLTDEELIQLAESMKMKVDESKSKAEAIEVEST